MDQMTDGHHRMVPDHARTGKAHDFLDPLAHLGFITVDLAVLAGRFFNPEGTFGEAFISVFPQFRTIHAQGVRLMVIPAVYADHCPHGGSFLG